MSIPAEVVIRTLSPTQAATRRRLLDAARTLATKGGYEGVSMRQVAAKAGVSAPTAYLYFSSKDHLLVDVLVDLVGRRYPVERDIERLEGASALQELFVIKRKLRLAALTFSQHIDFLETSILRNSARGGERLQYSHSRQQGIRTGACHFAKEVNALAVDSRDDHRHLRIGNISLQALANVGCELSRRLPCRLDVV